MKPINGYFVEDNVYYFLLGYLDDTGYEFVYSRKLEKYDESLPKHRRLPMFKFEWLTKEQFNELFDEAVKYYKDKVCEQTDEKLEEYFNSIK